MNFYPNRNETAPPPPNHLMAQGRGGFTLIEILVAVTVFALLVTGLFSAFNRLVGGMGTVEKGASVYAQARICFDRIVDDLQSVYVALPPAYEPPEFDADPDPYRFICINDYGDGGRLRFVAFSHLPLGRSLRASVGRIIYYLHTTSKGRTLLMRSDDILQLEDPDPSGADPVVCENVKSFVVQCYDENGNAYDRWDSEAGEFDYATPRAVKVVLEVIDDAQADRTYKFETMVAVPVYREAMREK